MKKRIKKIALTALVRRVDSVLVCGSLGEQYFLRYGARRDRIFYVPYEPDYSLIQEGSEEKRREAMSRFGLPPDRRRIVFSGRLVPHKRPELPLEAFIDIADARPEWDLLMIGGGVMREKLEASVPERLRARITWTGFLDDQRS